ncbi:MAG: 1-deoxy-D-xylulose-5-phosphate synthase [Alphaproteobacteria bacterium MarineAlpha5_Bin11]|nr:1-deoxy-D-xylulose-5-phosphate synthase [Pelagibacteraceae bacterium]PPR42594.1 MAG: 1-deoxy-D-xylulose-5-phosphate synthase [Alphaproteobacteria bacterium MarineAlpha5_Bin11]|tara:strand:+ start:30758 stop:32686 length:1929 start_codon:yes stop_codon:yes gene_type:complete
MEKKNILNSINSVKDLKKLSIAELKILAKELRNETIKVVSRTGGHLGAGLGVVELTIAVHYIFDAPDDKIIWDVGHQSYPHKILTGRKDRIHTLRQKDGIYGFTKRSESEYDPFGAAHSSTSISSALGMGIARDIQNKNHNIISIIGDGALSAGMAYEAMNNTGVIKSQFLTILNDNDMSISKPVGAMSTYLSKLLMSKSYTNLRSVIKKIAEKLPNKIAKSLYRAEEYSKGIVAGGTLFEELGFYYVGPIDGHNINDLVSILRKIKDSKIDKPILLHIITKKGKGYPPAENSYDKFHGVEKFDVISGNPIKSKSNIKTYTKVFSETLIEEALIDDKIVAVTAAMSQGTGLDSFAAKFPKRFFDVGIAEQHAVTMCAGMAAEGLKPFAAIYSTFLQRAYDQVVHDVAIQKLPVRFAIDRAGLVGADGATHAGSFDITYLSCLPNFVIMAAGDELELKHMVKTAVSINDRPSAFRYPRGSGIGLNLEETSMILEIGKGRILYEGKNIAILNLGGRLKECIQAREDLSRKGINITLADARFAKPLDTKMIDSLLDNHRFLITIEEGSIGGFGSLVLNYIHNNRKNKTTSTVQTIFFPDKFVDHATPEDQYQSIEMDAKGIEKKVYELLNLNKYDYVKTKTIISE